MRFALYIVITMALVSTVTWAQSSLPAKSAVENTTPTRPESGAKVAIPDSTALEVIKQVQPAYPQDAASRKLEAAVVPKVSISPAGDVITTETKSGDPTLAKSAADAVKEWKFRPFVRSGSAVNVSSTLSFVFIYRDKEMDDLSTAKHTASDQSVMQIVWVKGEIVHKHKIADVAPQYPWVAKEGRIQGPVVLFAVIGQDGRIRHLQVISGHPALVTAASEAVKQWRYRPYILGGVPVEVQTNIIVNFTLSG